MHVCMYVRVYTYVYGWQLTIGMYISIYVYIHIGIGTYLRGYVECVSGRMYFVWKPLI